LKEINLVNPSVIYKQSFLELVADVKKSGYESYEQYAKAEDNFDEFIEELMEIGGGVNIKVGWAPCTTYWLVSDLEVIGVIRIRHHVDNEKLQMAGHIGYEIVSQERIKGYGTNILELGLIKAKEMGLNEVLITCDAKNIGSKSIINKFNPAYIKTFVDDDSGNDVIQYKVLIDSK
jgi:predicted acetyltransferase